MTNRDMTATEAILNYTLDSAIINAAKVAYLNRLLENGINEIRHYT